MLPRLAALLLVLATPIGHASAFVCSRVLDSNQQETGPSLSWFSRTLEYNFWVSGTTRLNQTDAFATIRTSFAEWEDVAGSDITFVEGPVANLDQVGYDYLNPESNENIIIFRDGSWPHLELGNNVIALTTTTFKAVTGELIDADIEFRTGDIDFEILNPTEQELAEGVVTSASQSNKFDLENTAVHEVGHFLGLAHATLDAATMDSTTGPGEVEKRSLFSDDSDALIFKYPSATDNGYCDSSSINSLCGFCSPPGVVTQVPTVTVTGEDNGIDSGCAQSGGSMWWLVALLGATAARRRRSRRALRSH